MAIQVSCVRCGKQFRAKDQFRGTRLKCPNCKATLIARGPHVCGTDVFISHSTADKQVADAVCAAMEGKHVRCWMAPRDIPAGASWGAAIVEGIEDSRLMLLVFSEHANASDQVLREVERAVAKKKPVVPLRIDQHPMRKDFEYFLASSQWIDATDGALDDHLATLTGTVRHLLLDKAEVEVDARASDLPSPPTSSATGAVERQSPRKFGRGPMAVAALILLGVLIGTVIYVKERSTSSAAGPSNQPTSVPTSGSTEEPPVDLLARFRIPDEVVSGDWNRTPEGIRVTGPAPGRANFGPPPPGDYDLRISFTTYIGDEAVAIVLSRFGINFALVLGMKGTPSCGFGFEDGKFSQRNITRRRPAFKLENGIKHEVVIRVRSRSTSAMLDGKPVADLLTRDYHELSLPRGWGIGPGGRNLLGFVTYRTVTIHSADCKAVREGTDDGGVAPDVAQ